ncbi:MAG: Ger(x)C family spore germination C-terminal domain-containing protein [Clostridia bacterium]
MKKIINSIKKTPMLWFFLLICLIYFPQAIISPAENVQVAIMTLFGIDIKDSEYEISGLALVPLNDQMFSENYKFVSAKGESLAKAIKNMQIQIGKFVGLTHTSVVIVGDEVAKNEMIDALDTLSRINNLGNDTIIINSKSAKDLVKASLNIDATTGKKLNDIVFFNEIVTFSTETDIESFYKGLFSPVKSSIVGKISLVSEESSGISSGSEENSAAGGSGSGGLSGSSGDQKGAAEKPNTVANRGEAIIFREGKKIADLSKEEVVGLNWINPQTNFEAIEVKNIKDEIFDGESLFFEVQDKRVRNVVRFVDGKPQIHFQIDLILHLEEIVNSNGKKQDYLSQKSYLTKTVQEKIGNEVKGSFSKSWDKLVENKTDVLGIYNICMKQGSKQFKKFLNEIGNKEDFLKWTKITISVSSSSVS